MVNHKRVDRLYMVGQLQLRRRTRKKVHVGMRQPLERPDAANEVWSMDFVFDRSAEGRVINPTRRSQLIQDPCHVRPTDGTFRHNGDRLMCCIIHDRQTLPQVIRNDNGKEFCGRAMLTWAHAHSVTLRLIEPGKPNQNAYIGSFNGRFRDECLNEYWFLNLANAKVIIETWRLEYNEERPKKALGGLTPAAYARQLANKSATVVPGL